MSTRQNWIRSRTFLERNERLQMPQENSSIYIKNNQSWFITKK